MKIGIYQPYFFPYIGHFQLIGAVDRFILYPDLEYIYGGWVNRNRIIRNKYGECYITVPVHRKKHIRIKDARVDNISNRWSKKIVKTIFHNYQRSPFFDEFYPLIEELLVKQTYSTIAELNVETLRATTDFLDIHTEIVCADTERYPGLEEHLAEMETMGYAHDPLYEQMQVPRMVIRIMEICRTEGSNHFVSAIGATGLYDKDLFAHYGITLNFLQTHPIQYKQPCKNFIPNLSIIDVLMHNGKEKTKELLTHYTLL